MVSRLFFTNWRVKSHFVVGSKRMNEVLNYDFIHIPGVAPLSPGRQ